MNMGRIKTKDIKRTALKLAEENKFKNDFEYNKKVLNDLKISESKKTRNKIAGYITRLMKRI